MGRGIVANDNSDNYCANCSCSLAHVRSCNKIYKLDILVHFPPEKDSLVSCENISVIAALKDLFSLNQCQISQGQGQQDQEDRHLRKPSQIVNNDGEVPLCLPCALILQDLYRSFKLFKSVRKKTSYISKLASPVRSRTRPVTPLLQPQDECSSSTDAGSPAGSDVVNIKIESIDDLFDENEIRQQERIIENSILGIASRDNFTDNDDIAITSDDISDSSSEGGPSSKKIKKVKPKIKPKKIDSSSPTCTPKPVNRIKKPKQDFEWIEKATLSTKEEAERNAVGSGWRIQYTNAWKGKTQVTYYCQRDGKDCPVKKRILYNENSPSKEVIYYETAATDHMVKIEKTLTMEVKEQLRKFVREGITKPKEILRKLDVKYVPPSVTQIKNFVAREKRLMLLEGQGQGQGHSAQIPKLLGHPETIDFTSSVPCLTEVINI